MSFKTILSVIGNRDQETDLAKAIELALQMDAHLTVLVMDIAITPTLSDYPVGTVWLDQRVEDMKALQSTADKARNSLDIANIPYDIEHFYTERPFAADVIYRHALYADLVLLGEKTRENSALLSAVVDGAVFEAQRPLLLTSATDKPAAKVRKVLLAWNSRPEAGRAAREAMDLLRHAEAVHLVVVDPDATYLANGGEPGADMAAYLARHGVNVVVDQLPSGGRRVQDVLNSHALEVGADLIVMGAYGHSRLRERVFGGVTQSILEECEVPVLIAR